MADYCAANESALAWWHEDGGMAPGRLLSCAEAAALLRTPAYTLGGDSLAYAVGGRLYGARAEAPADARPVLAIAPSCPPEQLGDPAFCRAHGIRYPYYAGAMANGIASEDLVIAMGRAGMLAFFGSAGLPAARVLQAIGRIQSGLGDLPYGFNLINSINEPALEAAVVDLYLQHGIPCIEASAYIALSLPLVRYRVHGIHRDADGRVCAPKRVIAKLSRVEVAARFFAPPPEKFLRKLVEAGDITEEQAALAGEIPMAQDVTAEADSAGHTDHRPALALLPSMLALRDEMQAKYGYAERPRVGLGGGLGTPEAVAAAFAMGAAYVVTGSVNQACVEAGTSDAVRTLLAKATSTDVDVAPAADMFEMGVTVQVLKKGTRFAQRATKLYEIYKRYDTLEDIPADERAKLEEQFFRAPLESIWEQTLAFFAEHDPRHLEKAEKDPRHKMALVFRWYLGLSSTWANRGLEDRVDDYQVWCGPAMGAFNEWAAGSPLEALAERRVADVALNLLYAAALLTRARALAVPGAVADPMPRPRPLDGGAVRAQLDGSAPALV